MWRSRAPHATAVSVAPIFGDKWVRPWREVGICRLPVRFFCAMTLAKPETAAERRGEGTLPDFPLVDAHVHLYDTDVIDYPWMKRLPSLNSLHGPAEYTAATGGVAVERLVFIEVDAAAGRHLDEAVWVETAARNDSRIGAIVAAMPLEMGAAVEPDIAAFASMPLARGVRRLIQGHVEEPGWCLKPDFVEGVKLVGKYGLGFEILHLPPADGGCHRTGAPLP